MTEQPHSGPEGPWSGSGARNSDDSERPFADSIAQPGDTDATADDFGVVLDSSDGDRGTNIDDATPAPFPSGTDEAAVEEYAPIGDGAEGESEPRRSRRRRGRRRSGRGASAVAEDESDEESSAVATEDEAETEANGADAGAETGTERKRRRRSRGGRGRRRRKEGAEDEAGTPADDEGPVVAGGFDDDSVEDDDGASEDGEFEDGAFEDGERASDDGPAKKRRRRGSRGGRRRKKKRTGDREDDSDDDGPADDSDDEAVGIDSIPGEDDDLGGGSDGRAKRSPAPTRRGRSGKKRVEVDDSGSSKSKGSRKRGSGSSSGETARTSESRREVPRDQIILVNAADPEETRVVVQEGDRIVDLVMSVNQHKNYVNDIYRGRVVNLEEAIGAAFVDFGQGRNGFLHASDVMHIYGDEDWRLDKLLTARTDAEEWQDDARAPTDSIEEGEAPKAKKKAKTEKPRSSRRKRKSISELLKRGQLVVAQITKDAIGDKGPTLTTYISIPGRYLVLMPSLEKTGVSRKIEDDRERRRLKRILQSLDIPAGMGVIVRTAGVGKTKEEISRDLEYLLAVWENFSKNLVLGRNPAPLYQESSVSIRTMRDLFSSRTKSVIVDDEAVYEEMREFTEKLMPEHLDRIQLHDGDRPLFHSYSVEQDFERLFARRVELPSGGSIVFDQTEALVAIDVNSGRTRNEGSDFEDIALKANLEAVPEIARQIKLRDLGGIIVVDFIDMMRPASRRSVEKAFRTQLALDRARSKVGRISQFGLLELTRQRLGPGLSKLLYESCSYCRGTGRRRTAQSKAQAVLRRLASALSQKGFTKIEVLVHPDTLEWLKRHDWTQVVDLESKSKRELVFVAVEDQHEDSVFHYLRADGREVRPGGRRRR